MNAIAVAIGKDLDLDVAGIGDQFLDQHPTVAEGVFRLAPRAVERIRKIGHAGTLDPLATGLLILCTGKKTKQIDLIQAQQKEYTGTFRLGQTTPSFDLETPVDAEQPYEHLTEADIRAAVAQFVGEITQTPPL